MVGQPNPYDELPYRSHLVEWAAPERLALASLLHGGPRAPLDEYRVLELGCGDAANLLPLAYYRRHAAFVGVDGAGSRIAISQARKAALCLSNLEFIHSDFLTAGKRVSGEFDYIIAHGVLSWIPDQVRDAILGLCSQRLRPGGLLYLNYNTRPGWNVRGLVREFLLAQTGQITALPSRAQLAQEVSAQLASSLAENEHPYSKLLANEFRFVCENDISYVAHEFLAPDNHPYWQSEFLALARAFGLEYVADADFNYTSGRIPEDLAPGLKKQQIIGRTLADTVDLLCYRQLHSPIFTRSPFERRPADTKELENLVVASCLAPCTSSDTQNPMFRHPSGYQVEVKEEPVRIALERLQRLWPRGLRVKAAFPVVGNVLDDLTLLHRNGLVELRCIEPGEFEICPEALNRLEARESGCVTTPYHTREAVPAKFNDGNNCACGEGQVLLHGQTLSAVSPDSRSPSMASAVA